MNALTNLSSWLESNAHADMVLAYLDNVLQLDKFNAFYEFFEGENDHSPKNIWDQKAPGYRHLSDAERSFIAEGHDKFYHVIINPSLNRDLSLDDVILRAKVVRNALKSSQFIAVRDIYLDVSKTTSDVFFIHSLKFLDQDAIIDFYPSTDLEFFKQMTAYLFDGTNLKTNAQNRTSWEKYFSFMNYYLLPVRKLMAEKNDIDRWTVLLLNDLLKTTSKMDNKGRQLSNRSAAFAADTIMLADIFRRGAQIEQGCNYARFIQLNLATLRKTNYQTWTLFERAYGLSSPHGQEHAKRSVETVLRQKENLAPWFKKFNIDEQDCGIMLWHLSAAQDYHLYFVRDVAEYLLEGKTIPHTWSNELLMSTASRFKKHFIDPARTLYEQARFVLEGKSYVVDSQKIWIVLLINHMSILRDGKVLTKALEADGFNFIDGMSRSRFASPNYFCEFLTQQPRFQTSVPLMLFKFAYSLGTRDARIVARIALKSVLKNSEKLAPLLQSFNIGPDKLKQLIKSVSDPVSSDEEETGKDDKEEKELERSSNLLAYLEDFSGYRSNTLENQYYESAKRGAPSSNAAHPTPVSTVQAGVKTEPTKSVRKKPDHSGKANRPSLITLMEERFAKNPHNRDVFKDNFSKRMNWVKSLFPEIHPLHASPSQMRVLATNRLRLLEDLTASFKSEAEFELIFCYLESIFWQPLNGYLKKYFDAQISNELVPASVDKEKSSPLATIRADQQLAFSQDLVTICLFRIFAGNADEALPYVDEYASMIKTFINGASFQNVVTFYAGLQVETKKKLFYSKIDENTYAAYQNFCRQMATINEILTTLSNSKFFHVGDLAASYFPGVSSLTNLEKLIAFASDQTHYGIPVAEDTDWGDLQNLVNYQIEPGRQALSDYKKTLQRYKFGTIDPNLNLWFLFLVKRYVEMRGGPLNFVSKQIEHRDENNERALNDLCQSLLRNRNSVPDQLLAQTPKLHTVADHREVAYGLKQIMHNKSHIQFLFDDGVIDEGAITEILSYLPDPPFPARSVEEAEKALNKNARRQFNADINNVKGRWLRIKDEHRALIQTFRKGANNSELTFYDAKSDFLLANYMGSDEFDPNDKIFNSKRILHKGTLLARRTVDIIKEFLADDNFNLLRLGGGDSSLRRLGQFAHERQFSDFEKIARLSGNLFIAPADVVRVSLRLKLEIVAGFFAEIEKFRNDPANQDIVAAWKNQIFSYRSLKDDQQVFMNIGEKIRPFFVDKFVDQVEATNDCVRDTYPTWGKKSKSGYRDRQERRNMLAHFSLFPSISLTPPALKAVEKHIDKLSFISHVFDGDKIEQTRENMFDIFGLRVPIAGLLRLKAFLDIRDETATTSIEDRIRDPIFEQADQIMKGRVTARDALEDIALLMTINVRGHALLIALDPQFKLYMRPDTISVKALKLWDFVLTEFLDELGTSAKKRTDFFAGFLSDSRRSSRSSINVESIIKKMNKTKLLKFFERYSKRFTPEAILFYLSFPIEILHQEIAHFLQEDFEGQPNKSLLKRYVAPRIGAVRVLEQGAEQTSVVNKPISDEHTAKDKPILDVDSSQDDLQNQLDAFLARRRRK